MEPIDILGESVYYSPDSDSEEEIVEKYQNQQAHHILRNAVIDFEMFSKLEPNTWVRQRTNGHFAPVAGNYSCFFGVQYTASYFSGYTPAAFQESFSTF